MTVASVGASVNVAAREHVLLTAQGAYLKLEGGNIQLHGLGKIEFKASMKEWAGPAGSTVKLLEFPGTKIYAGRFQLLDLETKHPLVHKIYRKKREDGTVIFGRTDENGFTQTVLTSRPEQLKISFDHNEKFHRAKIDDEEVSAWFNGDC